MSFVELVPALYSDVVFIARRMRALDAEEILPLVWGNCPEDLALQSVSAGGLSTVALSGVEPVAAYGAYFSRPGIWSVWMFATDSWPMVGRAVTRDIRRRMMPEMLDTPGAVRADCWSMEGHDEAHRWLEVLGAIREASVEDYGATRRTFHCYSWTRSRFERDGSFDHVHRTIRAKDALAADAGAATATGATADAGRSGCQCGSGSGAEAPAGGKGPTVHDLVRFTGRPVGCECR